MGALKSVGQKIYDKGVETNDKGMQMGGKVFMNMGTWGNSENGASSQAASAPGVTDVNAGALGTNNVEKSRKKQGANSLMKSTLG